MLTHECLQHTSNGSHIQWLTGSLQQWQHSAAKLGSSKLACAACRCIDRHLRAAVGASKASRTCARSFGGVAGAAIQAVHLLDMVEMRTIRTILACSGVSLLALVYSVIQQSSLFAALSRTGFQVGEGLGYHDGPAARRHRRSRRQHRLRSAGPRSLHVNRRFATFAAMQSLE
jgi:hypothetical protein